MRTAPDLRDDAVGVSVPITAAPPGIWRRLACFTYEGVLLFGVLMISGYLFSSLTQQRNAMVGRHELQAFLFVILGIYFVWFWAHGGQTVAMKTWNIRLLTAAGAPVSQARAFVRYVLSWLWFLPALGSVWLSGARSLGVIFGAMIAGISVYALIARVHPSRQFLHDVMAGTCLVSSKPAAHSVASKPGAPVASTEP